MPLQIIAGPAGSGKSQIIADEIRPGWVLVDFTNFYVALSGVVRGPDGRYPPRLAGDPLIPIVAAVREFALQQAVRREIPGFVTTASFSEVSRLEELVGSLARVIDPGEDVVRARLAGPSGVSPECEAALARWYGRE